uniref:Uncharacterized protein n=1 Tax=Gasterosteus aculeatus TaxID=69293 RepID=G3N5B0_GASAC
MSTIQNQTVLFVPHLDLCEKTPSHPLKHNFKHHKLVNVSLSFRSAGVHPESCSPLKKKKEIKSSDAWDLCSGKRSSSSVIEGCSPAYALW